MENSKDFDTGDLVWAKMKGFPAWPARIVEPLNEKVSKQRKGQYFVYFFGSNNYAWIHDENIFPHSDHMIQTANKYKAAAFKKAVELIIYYNENNINKNKRIDNECLKLKNEKISAVNGSKIHNKSKSIKCTVSNAKIHERKHFKTQNKNSVAVSPKKKTIQKRKGQIIIEKPVIEPMDTNTASVSWKELNVKPTEKKIGFLGLGPMGSCIVKKLLDSGHQVSVYNRTHEKCDYLVEAGAHKFLTPADLVAHSDIIFSCVSDPDATKALLYGEFGVLAGLELYGESKGYIEMTTVGPDTVKECSAVIAKTGARYLEAPFHGSKMQAEKGALLVFAAGDQSLFLDCETCFQAIASRAIYIDYPIGTAAKINLVLNMLHCGMNVSLAETMALAERTNVNQCDFIQYLKGESLNCPAINESLEAIEQCNFAPNTPLKHIEKVIALYTEMKKNMNSSSTLAFATNEVIKHSGLEGCKDKDVSFIYQALKHAEL